MPVRHEPDGDPTGLTFPQLLEESFVGIATDPALAHVCTDEEAAAAATRLGEIGL